MADDTARLVVNIEARLASMDKALKKAVSSSEGAGKRIEKGLGDSVRRTEREMERAAERMNASLSSVGRSLMIGAGIGSVSVLTKQIVGLADAWTSATNKIAAAGVPLGEVNDRMQTLADIANETRTGVTETADLYARLSRAADQLGASQGDILRVTETVNKALKSGGATTQEAAAAVLQFGQALGSGVLQGDELRSIRENSQVLAQAIADEFGVTIGGLKKLGEEGKLTSDRVFRAVLNAAGGIDEAFSRTRMTVADAGVVFNNEMTRFIASVDDAYGVSKTLASIFVAVGRNAELVAGAIAGLATVFSLRLVAGGVNTAIAALAQLQAKMIGTAATTAATSTAFGVAATKARVFGAALLGAFGGPVGAAITAIGIGVGYLVTSLGEASQAAGEYGAATGQIVSALELVAQMQGEAAQSAKALAGDMSAANSAQADAEGVSRALAAARREETIATLSAAQAAAYLRMESARARLETLKERRQGLHNDLARETMIPEFTDKRVHDRLWKDLSDTAAEIRQVEGVASSAEEVATLLWNTTQKIISGELAAPSPESGRGAAGAIHAVTKEAQGAIDKLKELEERRRNWRNDPEMKGDQRAILEGISDRSTQAMSDREIGPKAAMVDAVDAAREEFRYIFSDFAASIRDGDIGGAFEGLFEDLTARITQRGFDMLADQIFDMIGGDFMTSLFNPLDASQAALATTTTTATTALGAFTAAVTAAAAAASANATTSGLAGAGGGIWGAISNMFGKRANGGPVVKGRPYVVGERRPELFVPNTSGRIIPEVPSPVAGGGAMTFAPVINAQGAGPSEVAALKQALAQSQAQFERFAAGERGRVQNYVSDGNTRRQINRGG